MTSIPLTMARRYVLGELSSRCEPVQNVPVYLDETGGEVLGFVDENSGKYADAITFHLADDMCKKLASGQFSYSVEYDYADRGDAGKPGRRRLRISSISLIARKENKAVAPSDTLRQPDKRFGLPAGDK